MPPDATATKARLLEAALNEFAEYGIAGARVDRIAAAAQANKRLIYLHFGNKEQLFETIAERCVDQVADAVPFTADDLPGYAGALFDYFLENPRLLRLTAWRQLEYARATDAEVAAYRSKVDAVASARNAGLLTGDLDPVDVLALVLGLVAAWPGASPALRSLAGDDPWAPERLAQHRAAVVAAVRGLLAEPGQGALR